MAGVLIQRACERFQSHLSDEDHRTIRSVKNADDVRLAIRQIEQHLASRQSLQDLGRLTPFVDAVDRLSKPIDVLCNGTPFLPYIWAPLKLILQAAQDHTRILEKILSSYASIGAALPRLSRYGEAFPRSSEFQQLLAHLYEDIIEFHTHAYSLIQKRAWSMFFASGWGRFERRFSALLEGIIKYSELIDNEALSLEILSATKWREEMRKMALDQEEQWENRRRQEVLNWLQDKESIQEERLEYLQRRCCEGTGDWFTDSPKVRSWLRRGGGRPILWLHGKPGSGKSVLCSKLIHSLRSDPTRKCLFFFCDFHTNSFTVTLQVLRHICTQIMRLAPEMALFIYEECIASPKVSSILVLGALVPKLLAAFEDIRLVVDGLDEVEPGEHAKLIKALMALTRAQDNFKLLISSQDIPSIRKLKLSPALFLGDEASFVAKDLSTIVKISLEELRDRLEDVPATVLTELGTLILDRAEGMFLWVHLVLDLFEVSSNIRELREHVENFPRNLAEAYKKILANITSRCGNDHNKLRRVFAWMIFCKGNRPLRKYELRIGMTLHAGSYRLHEDTKPFANSLNICKPFIEDGPGESVVFVHSTVPQFLRDKCSGPFIDTGDSHRDISLACLAQLRQSLFFIENPAHSHRLYCIGQGFHGLLPYANEYWVDHLLQYLHESKGFGVTGSSPVKDQLLALCREHNELSETRNETDGTMSIDMPSQDKRLSCLADFPKAYDLAKHVLDARQVETANNETPTPQMNATLFSFIIKIYHEGVIQLLTQSDACPKLSQKDLITFREEFGQSAYVCQTRGCDRSVVGFQSSSRQKDHEARHQSRQRCPEENCPYNDVGFSSSKRLRDHKRKHHPDADQMRIPRRIAREKLQPAGLEWINDAGPSDTTLQDPKGAERNATPLPSQVISSNLADMDIENVPPHAKEIHDGWSIIFNQNMPRVLHIGLAHTLQHDNVVACVRFSHDGKYLATGSNKSAQVYKVATAERVCVFLSPTIYEDNYVRGICFSTDGKYLVTGNEDRLVRVWELSAKTLHHALIGHEGDVYGVDCGADNKITASCSEDRTVRLWDIEKGISTLTLAASDGLRSVTISPNGFYVIAGGINHTIQLWNISQGDAREIIAYNVSHTDDVYNTAFVQGGNSFVTCSLDKTVKVWELVSRGLADTASRDLEAKCIRTIQSHKDFVLGVAVTPDAHWIISSSKDLDVHFLDVNTGETHLRLRGHVNSVISVDASPIGGFFATASGDMTARIWSYGPFISPSSPI